MSLKPSPVETAFGLQPGEAYGADEICHTDETEHTFSGRTFQVFYDQMSGPLTQWKAFCHGLGTLGRRDRADVIAAMQARIQSALVHRTPETYDQIHLGDDEWGSDLMEDLAIAHFAEFPDCHFVEVREHAGWYLIFHRSGATVGTANGSAIMDPHRPLPKRWSGYSHRRP